MVNPWHEDMYVRLFDHEFMMVFLNMGMSENGVYPQL